jgi:hypothetical protein
VKLVDAAEREALLDPGAYDALVAEGTH